MDVELRAVQLILQFVIEKVEFDLVLDKPCPVLEPRLTKFDSLVHLLLGFEVVKLFWVLFKQFLLVLKLCVDVFFGLFHLFLLIVILDKTFNRKVDRYDHVNQDVEDS